jgi:NitT/TauT family transport system substrate-binding protein
MRLDPADLPAVGRRWLGRSSRSVAAGMTGLAVALLAAGCGVAGHASHAPRAETPITVAAEPGVDDAPLYIAENDGLFAKAGLKVKIRSFGSAAGDLTAMHTGLANIGFGDYVDYFHWQDVHKDLIAVADGYDAAPGVVEVLSLPHSGIYTPQNLAGKIIGTAEPQGIATDKAVQADKGRVPYSIETVATQSVLGNDGVNTASVTWKAMPSQNLIGALQSHQVNAILVTEPYIYEAEERLGAVEVLDSCSGATANLPLAGYFTSKTFASKDPGAVREFRSALLAAQAKAVLAKPVDAVLAKFPGMDAQSASLVTVGVYPTSLNAGSLQRVSQLMFNFGVLPHFLNVSSMVPSAR